MVINIIQNECVSKVFFAVYHVYCGPSSMKFGIKVTCRTLITGNILRSSYLGNRCHGNQRTSSELIHILNDNGCKWNGKEIFRYHGFLVPW